MLCGLRVSLVKSGGARPTIGIADCRRRTPGMSNEPNFARRTIGGHGPPYGMGGAFSKRPVT